MGQPGRDAERGSLTHLPPKGSGKATNCVCTDITSCPAGLFGAQLGPRLRWGSRGIAPCRDAGQALRRISTQPHSTHRFALHPQTLTPTCKKRGRRSGPASPFLAPSQLHSPPECPTQGIPAQSHQHLSGVCKRTCAN